MADFSFITNRLLTGAAINDDADARALVEAGVTHVVDCRAEFDDAHLLLPYGVAYLFNGVQDDGLLKPNEWFQTSILFTLRAFGHHWHAHTKKLTRVYLHCAAGINRGPSATYAILRAWGIDPVTAEGMIRARRPQVGIAYKNDADRAIRELGYE